MSSDIDFYRKFCCHFYVREYYTYAMARSIILKC